MLLTLVLLSSAKGNHILPLTHPPAKQIKNTFTFSHELTIGMLGRVDYATREPRWYQKKEKTCGFETDARSKQERVLHPHLRSSFHKVYIAIGRAVSQPL